MDSRIPGQIPMNSTDLRWQQRFANFQKALLQLDEAVAVRRERPLSNLEKQGVIEAFANNLVAVRRSDGDACRPEACFG